MNKKVLIGVVALIILAGGAYAMQSKQSVPPSQTQSEAMGEAEEFAKAIESGRPTTCIMTKGDDIMEYHLKGQMMSANITTKVEGQTTLSHMIKDQEYLYIWIEGQNQGTKMSMTLPSPSPLGATDPTDSMPTLDSDNYDQLQDEGYTINCRSGNFNDSVFTPPTTINFIDPSVMMEAVPTLNSEGGYDMNQLKELQKQYGGFTGEDQ